MDAFDGYRLEERVDIFLDGNGPAYLQLVRAIKSAIRDGRLVEGDRLPPSRELCRQLGLSRTTVVSAYDLLRAEGYTDGLTGSGSYVARRMPISARKALPPATMEPQSRRSRMARDIGILNAPGRRPADAKYAFEYGQPLTNETIAKAWAREIRHALDDAPVRYPSIQGNEGLRKVLSHHLERTRGIVCSADDILIVSGVQQALQLCSLALLDPGDRVAMEYPHYFAAQRIFRLANATIVDIPVDEHGMRTEELAAVSDIKAIYVTPSHQFPTGTILSEARRQALLDFAGEHACWILEDDYDGEFSVRGAPIRSLQSLDEGGRTIYIGTFSKTFSADVRIGYIVSPPGIKADLLAAKWTVDHGCPVLPQIALANLLKSGAYDRHIRWASDELLARRTLITSELVTRFGTQVRFHRAHSGMHVFAMFPTIPSAYWKEISAHALQSGLALYNADACYTQLPKSLILFLGFSSLSRKEIPAAMDILEQCLSPHLHGRGMDSSTEQSRDNVILLDSARRAHS